MKTKRAKLREILAANAPLVVAYSGGVDSTFLLAEAHAVLGDHMVNRNVLVQWYSGTPYFYRIVTYNK